MDAMEPSWVKGVEKAAPLLRVSVWLQCLPLALGLVSGFSECCCETCEVSGFTDTSQVLSLRCQAALARLGDQSEAGTPHLALLAEHVFLRALVGIIVINSSGRTQGGDTCNLAVRPTRPYQRDPSLEICVRSTGQGQETQARAVCAPSLKVRGNFGKLLQSLSLVIRKMGIMMQPLGFHSAIH